jgi:putative membrane protein
MMHGFGYGGWGLGLIGWLFSLVISLGLLAILVWVLAWLWRRVSSGGRLAGAAPGPGTPAGPPRAEMSPKEILQVRYTRGEITREQYQQMLADLG